MFYILGAFSVRQLLHLRLLDMRWLAQVKPRYQYVAIKVTQQYMYELHGYKIV